jgi:hypothetical protein
MGEDNAHLQDKGLSWLFYVIPCSIDTRWYDPCWNLETVTGVGTAVCPRIQDATLPILKSGRLVEEIVGFY